MYKERGRERRREKGAIAKYGGMKREKRIVLERRNGRICRVRREEEESIICVYLKNVKQRRLKFEEFLSENKKGWEEFNS